jgi:aryl-alcohol dehydrogenase-like predicted oxidoreductase
MLILALRVNTQSRFKRTGKRDEIFLATKFGVTRDPTGKRPVNGDPTYMKECFEKSLSRLGGESESAARKYRR